MQLAYFLTRRTPHQSQLAAPMPRARHAYLTVRKATRTAPAFACHLCMPIVSPHPININIAIAVAAHLSGLVAIHDLVSSRIDLMAAYTHIHRSILTYLYSPPHGSNAESPHSRLFAVFARRVVERKSTFIGCSSSRTAPNCLSAGSGARGPDDRLDRAWRLGRRLEHTS